MHKVQGLNLHEVVVSFQLERQRSFNAGQIYVALSRSTSFNGLFLTGTYTPSAIIASEAVHKEYERLRSHENLLKPLESFSVFDSTLNITLLNIRSLLKHVEELQHHKDIISSDVLLLTETQIGQSYNINLEYFKQNLNDLTNLVLSNDVDKFKSLFLGHTDEVFVESTFRIPGFLLFDMEKNSFSELSLKVLLVYRSHQENIHDFLEALRYILTTHNDISIALGDFNIDFLKNDRTTIELKNLIFGFKQIIDKPTHINGGLIDHIYVRKSLFDVFEIDFIKTS